MNTFPTTAATTAPRWTPAPARRPGRRLAPAAAGLVAVAAGVAAVAVHAASGSAASAAVVAPHAGTYHLVRSGSGSGQVLEGVQTGKRSGDATPVTIVVRTATGAERLHVDYTSAGAWITGEDVALKSGVLTCRFVHPLELLPATISTGESWSTTSTCPLSSAGVHGTVTMTLSDSVEGTENVTLNGRSGTAFIVDGTVTTATSSGGHTVTATETERDDYLPGLGLAVRSQVQTKSGGSTTTETTTLQGLTVG